MKWKRSVLALLALSQRSFRNCSRVSNTNRVFKTAVSSLQVPPPNSERCLSSVVVKGSLKLQSRR